MMVMGITTGSRANASPRIVLDGRVVAPDGQPVAGAVVTGSLEWDDQSSTFRTDPTAADGSFKLALEPSASTLRSIRAAAYKRGFSDAREVRTPPHGRKGYRAIVLTLRSTIDWTVRIVDEANHPVTTAIVTIADDSWSTEHPLKGIGQHVDASGSLTYHGLDDQDGLDVIVTAPGYLDVRASRARIDAPFTISMAHGGVMKGRLIDHATGDPIAHCDLQSYAGKVTTDPGGAFQLTAPYGGVVLWPACPHYGTDYDLAPGGLSVTFDAKAAGGVHTVTARRNQVVTVRVIAPRLKSVAGITITRTFSPANPYQPTFIWRGPPFEVLTTDAHGEVTFDQSSMDEFDLRIDARTPITRHVTYAQLRGPLTIALP